jgi:hypothetical protein
MKNVDNRNIFASVSRISSGSSCYTHNGYQNPLTQTKRLPSNEIINLGTYSY